MSCYNGDLPAPLKLYSKDMGVECVQEIQKVKCPDLFGLKLRAFVDSIKNGTEATIPSSQILYNQAIIDGIVKSNAVGHEIAIEIPEI